MQNSKPTLGYFSCYIDPKDLKVQGTGEDQTHQLEFAIKDELFFSPEAWTPNNIEINFDGGRIKLSRQLFQKLTDEYEQRYQKDIHHSAIAELRQAVEVLPNKEQVERFKVVLASMEHVLDAQRGVKR